MHSAYFLLASVAALLLVAPRVAAATAVAQSDELCARMQQNWQTASAALQRGDAATAERNMFEIEALYQRAIALAPEHTHCHNVAGHAALSVLQFDNAITRFEAAARFAVDPSLADAALNMANHARLGRTSVERDRAYALGQGNISLAIELTRKQLELRPDSAQYWYELGKMLMSRADGTGDERAALGALEAFQRSLLVALEQLAHLSAPSPGVMSIPALACASGRQSALATPDAPAVHRERSVFIAGVDGVLISGSSCLVTACPTAASYFNLQQNLPLPSPLYPRGAVQPRPPPVTRSFAASATTFSIVGHASANFYHFLSESLPRLVAMRAELLEASRRSPPLRLLVPDTRFAHEWSDFAMHALFAAAPPTPRYQVVRYSCPEARACIYVAGELVTFLWPPALETALPGLRTSHAPAHLLRETASVLRAFAKLDDDAGDDFSVIFLSRTHVRALINESAVADAALAHVSDVLARSGSSRRAVLRTLNPDAERLSPAQTVRLFARAALVIGVHGAAMTNVIFMRERNAAVVEIGFRSPFSNYYRQLAANLGIAYAHAPLAVDERATAAHQVRVDVDAVRDAISAVLSTIQLHIPPTAKTEL